MAQKAPGKSDRKGISLVEITNMFPNDEAAEKWIIEQRWPDGPYCPHCGSLNVQSGIKHSSMTHRCRDCPNRPMFSLKTGTVMKGTQLGYREWAIAIYLMSTSLKGVSSMKLHRDLDVTQKTAWYLAHRLRESWKTDGQGMFSGPVEVDETYMGGKRKNMPKAKRVNLKGRGPAGKTAIVGAKDRATNVVSAKVVANTDAKTLHKFVADNAADGATVYTDDAKAYWGIPFDHESVRHSVGEYVNGMAHTNGIESFWSMLKRAHKGTFHKLSPKHLDRYVGEFVGRHNIRRADTIDQMQAMVKGLEGKRLSYRDLVA